MFTKKKKVQAEATFDCTDEEQIRQLLLFHKITAVKDDTLYLDNDTELQILPNKGCDACSNGWYYLAELHGCDNLITRVEFECEQTDDESCFSYKIYVFAEDQKIKLAQVDGDDGNGYYGSGYQVRVRVKA